MADPKHVHHWLSRLDTMGWFQQKLAPEQHAQRRAMYADALAAMGAEQLDDACREWLKVGRHYPSPAELWEIASESTRASMPRLEAPEHRPHQGEELAKPRISDPEAMAIQILKLKASGQAYDRISARIGELMMERAGYGHLIDGLGEVA